MKITATIVLTLISFGLLGQPSEWDREVIVKNKVKDVLVYTRVPKTNPDYFKEAIGLMLISETNFDRSGQVIQINCKNCYYMSDTDGDCCSDIIEKFVYKNDRLIRIDEMDFHKSTSLYSYDTLNHRRLVIGLDRDDERNKTRIEHFDKQGREIWRIEIDFDNIWVKGDTVYQVFISKTFTTYNQQAKTTEEFGRGFGSNIDRLKFETFKNSNVIEEIEEIFKVLDLSFLESRSKLTTYYDNKGREEKIVNEKNGTTLTIYNRDKNGLIKRKKETWPKNTFEYEYQYRLWN